MMIRNFYADMTPLGDLETCSCYQLCVVSHMEFQVERNTDRV